MTGDWEEYKVMQDLGDIIIRDVGIVRHPLGAINSRSIDVYPLQFINANCIGVETRTHFPVVKARVHEQEKRNWRLCGPRE